jgi:hypothetical protein
MTGEFCASSQRKRAYGSLGQDKADRPCRSTVRVSCAPHSAACLQSVQTLPHNNGIIFIMVRREKYSPANFDKAGAIRDSSDYSLHQANK